MTNFGAPQELPDNSLRSAALAGLNTRLSAERATAVEGLRIAAQRDPAIHRRQRELAAKSGMSLEAVEQDPEFAKRFAREEALRFAREDARFPVVAASLRDTEFASMSADDLEHLREVESTFGWLRANWRNGRNTYERGVSGTMWAAEGLSRDEILDRAAKIPVRGIDNGGFFGFIGDATEVLGQWASMLSTSALTAAAVAAPVAAVSGPAAPISGGAVFAKTFTATSLLQAAMMEGGNAYIEYMEAGYDPEAAKAAALGVGILGGAAEFAGARLVAAPFTGLGRKLLGKGAAAAVTQTTATKAWTTFGKQYLKAVGGEVGTEMFQEAVQMAGEEYARMRTDPRMAGYLETSQGRQEVWDRMLGIAEKTAKAMILLGLPGPVANLYVDSRRAASTEAQKTFLGKLATGAAESELRKEAPAQFRAVVAEMTGETVPELYITKAALRQTIDKLEADATAGGTESVQDTLAKALPDVAAALSGTGEDVVIKTADFATHLAGTTLGEALAPHLRAEQGAMSAAEMDRYAPQLEEEAERLKETFKDNVEQLKEHRRQLSELRKRVSSEIVAAGRSVTEARLNARLYSSFVSTNAPRVQVEDEDGTLRPMTVAEFDEVYRLSTVASEEQPAGEKYWRTKFKANKATPRYGTPQKGSSSFLGVHYAYQARESLDTNRYGQGMRGRESARVQGDPVLSKRSHFYYDRDGTGIEPESGVGNVAHVVQLDNIYDTEKDELGIVARVGTQDPNKFERAIVRAGFDGYSSPNALYDQGMIVVLGKKHNAIPVRQQAGVFRQAKEAKPKKAAKGKKQTARTRARNFGDIGLSALTRGRQVPPGVVEAAGLAAARALQKEMTQRDGAAPDNRPLKEALQGRLLAALKAAKLPAKPLDKMDQGTFEYLVQAMTADATLLLSEPGGQQAVGWYDETVRTAMAVVAEVFPELETDSRARFAFTYALAVTSNGLKVDKNFEMAAVVYRYWRENKRMPTDGTGVVGKQGQPMIDAFTTWNEFVDRLGIDGFETLLTTQATVSDLAKAGIVVGDENASTMVYGAAMLGPKIGNGFFMNLRGVFTQLTMDRWLYRTFARHFGGLIEVDPATVRKHRKLVQLAWNAADKAATVTFSKKRTVNKQTVYEDQQVNLLELTGLKKRASASEVGETIARMSADPKFRDAINEIPGGAVLRRAANLYAKSVNGEIERPKNGTQRNWIRAIVAESMRRVKEAQPELAALTVADFQAVLWYGEKLLYESGRKKRAAEASTEYSEDEKPDYANAAVKLARAEGVSEDRINEAKQRAADAHRAAVESAGDDGPGDADGDADGAGGIPAAQPRPPLAGLESVVMVDGQPVQFGPDERARAAAAEYAERAGIDYQPPGTFVPVDVERAKRIARAFDEMKHEPDNPEVAAAYEALIEETLAQWQVIKETGLVVEFIEGADPYGNPRNAILDVVENNHLWVYPTDAGFGGSESANVDITGNPLLRIVEGETISGRPVRVNDIFRIVHDYFGHVKEGVGFRARGEENAWQQHMAMYSPLARKALTVETRGQNSWVNYGPFAEANRTADGATTQYAPQKIGLLPDWVVNEGYQGGQGKFRQTKDFFSRLTAGVEAAKMESGTGAAWKQHIQAMLNKGQVKKAEVEHTGVMEWLGLQEAEKLTRKQVRDYVHEAGFNVETRTGPDSFRKYVQPGGLPGTYSERLIVAPGEAMGKPQPPLDQVQKYGEFRFAVVTTVDDVTKPGALWGAYSTRDVNLQYWAAVLRRNVKLAREAAEGEVKIIALPEILRREDPTPYDLTEAEVQEAEAAANVLRDQMSESQRAGPSAMDTFQVSGQFYPETTGVGYKSSHWSERNVIAHVRSTRMPGPDGDIFAVQEIQSDWAHDLRAGATTLEGPFVANTEQWVSLALKRAALDAIRQRSNGYLALPDGAAVAGIFGMATFAPYFSAVVTPRGRYNVTLYQTDTRDPQQLRVANTGAANLFEVNQQELAELVGEDVAANIVANAVPLAEVVARSGYALQRDEAVEGWGITRNGERLDEIEPYFWEGDAMNMIAGLIHNEEQDTLLRPRTAPGVFATPAAIMTASGRGLAAYYDNIVRKTAQKVLPSMGLTELPREAWPTLDSAFGEYKAGSVWRIEDSAIDTVAGGVSYMQTQDAEPEAIVNIGLNVGAEQGITPEQVLAALQARGLTVSRWEVQQSNTESTVVAALDRELTKEEGDAISVELKQEAIAVRRRDGSGMLFGPKAAEWGPYNPEYFLMFGGRRASEVDAERAAAAATEEARAAEGEPGVRGEFDPAAQTIGLTSDADSSTWLHELGHYFLNVYERMTLLDTVDPAVRDDFKKLLDWFGVTEQQWRGFSLEEKRKYHEQFAYSFELYLFENKAPAPELRSLFRRFSDWLKLVYRELTRDPRRAYFRETGEELPPMSDEVREVIDRMLVSEDTMRAAQAVYGAMPMFQTKAEFIAAGFDGDQWDELQELQAQADSETIDELTRRSLRDMKWQRNARGKVLRKIQAEAKELRDAMRDEVAAEVAQQPVQRLLAWMRGKDGLADPEGQGRRRLNRAAVEALFPFDDTRAQYESAWAPFLSNDGMSPDAAAQLHGFPTTDAMIDAVVQAPAFDEAVEKRIDERMLAEHGELSDPKKIEEAVDAALHTQARARFVATELAAITQGMMPVRVMLAAARLAAEAAIGSQQVRKLQARWHTVAEQRAARDAFRYMREGKTEQAILAKRQQLRHGQLAVAAVAAREDVENSLRKFRRFYKSDESLAKTRDIKLVQAVRAILAAFEVGGTAKQRATMLERSEEFLAQLKAYDPPMYDEVRALIDDATANKKNFRDLSYDDFRLLRDTVEAIWFEAKRRKQIVVNGRKVAIEEAQAEMQAQIESVTKPSAEAPGMAKAPGAKDRTIRALQGLRSAMLRAESEFDLIDGTNKDAPWTTYLFRPVQKAIDAYRVDRTKFIKKFVALLDGVELKPGKIAAPEIGYEFGHGNNGLGIAELLGAMLHMGNKSNASKLLVGRKWTDLAAAFDEDGNLNTGQWDVLMERLEREGIVTKQHWDFVHSVWRLMDEIKPLTQQAHMDLYGRFFTEVKPWRVKTSFGEYEGGYVPAKVDTFIDPQARIHESVEQLEADARYAMPAVGKGFSIKRVEEYRRPLSIDVRLLSRHIDETTRFAHVQPAMRDALSLLRSQELRDAVALYDPVLIDGMILPWLQRAARQTVQERGLNPAVDNFWRNMRTRTGLATMFLNVSNALQQVTGWFPAALKVKPSYLIGGLKRYLSSPKAVTAGVADLSPFMRERLQSQVFDMKERMDEIVLNPGKFQKAQAWSQRNAYVLQSAFQNLVDVTTWTGAHEQALAEKKSPEDAVAIADAAVRLTQGGTAPEQVARFEAGTPFTRLWTQFQGYFNMLANLNRAEMVKVARQFGWSGAPRLFGIYVLGFAAPMLVADAIARGFSGEFDDEDDDGYGDEFLGWLFGGQVRGAFALIPYGGNAAVVALNSWNDKPYDDRMMSSPSISALEAATVGVARAVRAAFDPERDISGKNVRDVLTLLTLYTGLPLATLGRPVGYGIDVSSGRVEPYNAADAARGFITGRAAEGTR